MIDYSAALSHAVKELSPSAIRRFFSISSEMEDVISLGVGEPDFKTPWPIREAAIRSLKEGKTWYTANAGKRTLRNEISFYLKRRFSLQYNPDSEIFLTVGGSEGLDLAIRTLVNPGEEVLIVEPSFVAYAPIVQSIGGIPVSIATCFEEEFRLTAAALKKAITPKAKLLILPYPNNPTGSIMRREDLEEIAAVIRKSNLFVLSDEIYAELTYEQQHISIASIEDMWERTIIVNGFSKSFAMTGWRMGFIAAPEPITSQMLKLHQYTIMCAPTTAQFAALTALQECENEVVCMRDAYDLRRKYLVSSLNKIGLPCFMPQGAFYAFPSIQSTGLCSEDFCERLLFQQKVAVIPGNAFGEAGEGFVRISYCYSLEHLRLALERIKRFIEAL